MWKEHSCAFEFGLLKRTQTTNTLAYIQANSDGFTLNCYSSHKIKYIKNKWYVIVHNNFFRIPGCLGNAQSPALSVHFFLAKRLNFFSLSFLAALGSGRAAEEVGAGRLWVLAPEGPGAASSAGGPWTACSMARLQLCSSSCVKTHKTDSERHIHVQRSVCTCLLRGIRWRWMPPPPFFCVSVRSEQTEFEYLTKLAVGDFRKNHTLITFNVCSLLKMICPFLLLHLFAHLLHLNITQRLLMLTKRFFELILF